MQVLLRAAFHIFSLRDKVGRIAIVVDSDTAIDLSTIVAFLRPWRAWLQVTDVLVTHADPDGQWLERIASNGAQALLVISERPEFGCDLEKEAGRFGLLLAGSDYPSGASRSTSLFHEMSHHHFELGGFNEWNKSAGIHSSSVLQHISAANCMTHFPRYVVDDLHEGRAAVGRRLDALDVGCGAISRLRWGALQGLLNITGIDPLLDAYKIIVGYHGLDRLPHIEVDRAITAGAEDLHRHVANESIDFAYCCNALDHVEDPRIVVERVAQTLRPGALFALEFATCEGSRQEWRQLHQFDLFLDADSRELMCRDREGHLDTLVPGGVRLTVNKVIVATNDHTIVVLQS
jgi:2-polyprenyl-3-methyl-5-hydroxy-6-metoxy-1,4-benzoquinol methylase